jgi:hypothetical protein
VDNEDVQQSAVAVVEMMNERLMKNGVEKKCAKLELKRVISALLITSKGNEEDEDIYAAQRFTMIKILKGKYCMVANVVRVGRLGNNISLLCVQEDVCINFSWRRRQTMECTNLQYN